MNVIDPMGQISLNGSSTLPGNEHPHIHSHHNQPVSGIEMEPVSQYAPVVVSRQKIWPWILVFRDYFSRKRRIVIPILSLSIQTTTQELNVVEDIGGSIIEVEQMTNGHHNLHDHNQHETIGMFQSWQLVSLFADIPSVISL